MKMQRTHTCGELRPTDAGQVVTLNGWVASCRDHGGVFFVDLRDRYGITQVTIDPGVWSQTSELKSETVIAVRGTVTKRPAESVNRKRATGEIELRAAEVELLNRCKPLPFEVTDVTDVREDLRMKYRYLDMRRKPLTDAIVFRSKVCQIIREVFHGERFIEVETPLLMKTTPEGARDFIVPSRLHPGEVYALPQSPQLFKQTLMVCGMDRYFQICKCLRDEDLRADRQPEFTQLDMEMSFVERDDVFRVIEMTVTRLWKELMGRELPAVFPRMSWSEAMNRYGIDKPDTRFGLELADCSEILAGSQSNIFRGAIEAGGTVRAINVPNGAQVTRKQIEELEGIAKEYGAKGLAWLKLTAQGPQGPAAKFLSAAELEGVQAKTGAVAESLLLFVADRTPIALAALARVRLALGKSLGLIDHARTDCLWIVDFPLFEWNEDSKTWQAMHHMFTSSIGELPADASGLGAVIGNLYDLVVNGSELGSGSIRIHQPEIQQRVFDLVGLSRAEAETKFGWFLRALDYGAPPHGGIALGLDRLIMVMLGAESLRDVIAFPKNSNGICALTESPSEPVGDALGELGLMLKPEIKAARQPK